MPEDQGPPLVAVLEEILTYAVLLPDALIQTTPADHPRVGWSVSNSEDYREWSFTPERLSSLVSAHPGLRNPAFDFSSPEGRAHIAVIIQDVAKGLKTLAPLEGRETLWQLLLKD